MHQPVLSAEVLAWLRPRPGGTFIDATLGEGGHARALAERIGPGGRLLGIDCDAEAVARVQAHGGAWLERCTLVQANFAELGAVARAHGFEAVDGVLMDLGVSSAQLEVAERGFSFMRDGPLDMRMDRSRPLTAAELVNRLGEQELAELLRMYGEEHRAARIARVVVAERARRPLTRTGQLAELITRAVGGRRGRTHPATRTFLALRIAVNDELAALDRALPSGLELLKSGGRMAVIAFHSLEDRRVKECFARHAGRWVACPAGGREWVVAQPEVRILTRKPVRPSEAERRLNPRARSARLRVAERKG